MTNDDFKTSWLKRHPLGFGILLGIVLVILFGIVSAVHHKAVGYISDNPSPFYASLPEQPLFWHRWTPHSLMTLGVLWFAVLLALMFLHSYVAALFYNFHFGGFALYADRFIVRAPLRDLSPQTYTIKDIKRIEVGCRIACFGHRCSDGGATAVYDVHLKNGRSYPLYQATLDDFDDPALIAAMAKFDSQVRKAGIPRAYKLNILSEPMSNRVCYERMQGHAQGDLLDKLRRASRIR